MKALIIVIPLLLVVVILVFGLYVAAVTGVNIPGFSGLRAAGSPPTQAELAAGQAAEQKVDASMAENDAFYVELTNEDLNKIIRGRMDPATPIKTAEVQVHPSGVAFSGDLNGVVPVPFAGTIGVELDDQGVIALAVKKATVMALPLPGVAKDSLEPVLNEVVALNTLFAQSGATQIQQVILSEGKVAVVGVQAKGSTVSATAKSKIQAAAGTPGAAGRPAPAVPAGATAITDGTVISKQGSEVYLAIGDSLAAAVGVPTGTQGYVSRFHRYLEAQTGKSLGLVNTGKSGESTLSIKRSGQWQRALDEIASRKSDGNPATKVSVVTLDIGANDLLSHLASSDCQNAPRGPACKVRIDAGMATFQTNFVQLTGELKAAMEPGTEFYIMTVYNPFSLGTSLASEQYSDEVLSAMNTRITQQAQAVGAKVADVGPLMRGNAGVWTLILQGDIHPNATGYQVLTYAFVTARGK